MKILEMAHGIIWGPWTVGIFLIVGLVLSVRCHFFQILGFKYWWKATWGSLWEHGRGNDEKAVKNAGHHGITQFQSVCTALAATVGTGNIAGVAAAIVSGGPGAVFWMWISALVGMATAYGETYLGCRYRFKDNRGKWVCGPFIYMEKGLGIPFMAVGYSFFCFLCALGMGSMVQANSAAETLEFTWGIPSALGSGILALLTGAVVLGGIKRIGKAAECLLPLASGIYILFSLLVLLLCADRIPDVFLRIFRSAFGIRQISGGIAGFSISKSLRYGISRGVFSNEAGLGTLAVLHGPAENTSPEEQGMWAMFEVFFDTVVLCTLTALVILCTSQGDIETFSLTGAALAAACFSARSGIVGKWFISVSMVVFAFATVIAWYYLGQQAVVYLKEKTGILHLHILYPILFLLAVFAGGCIRLEAIWMLSDLWNGLMAFFNLTALLFLSGEVCIPDSSDLFNTTKKTPHVK
mgnify:FL=1